MARAEVVSLMQELRLIGMPLAVITMGTSRV